MSEWVVGTILFVSLMTWMYVCIHLLAEVLK